MFSRPAGEVHHLSRLFASVVSFFRENNTPCAKLTFDCCASSRFYSLVRLGSATHQKTSNWPSLIHSSTARSAADIVSDRGIRKVAPDFKKTRRADRNVSDAGTLEQDAAVLQTEELPSQVDHLDGDGMADELAFKLTLPRISLHCHDLVWQGPASGACGAITSKNETPRAPFQPRLESAAEERVLRFFAVIAPQAPDRPFAIRDRDNGS